MVYSSQTSDEPEYYSKAEVINGVYEAQGLIYGTDYNRIRLYNYSEESDSQMVSLYCTYLYRELDETDVDLDAGLCSASGGYIYAYNCDIRGVMGIKMRAGGNAESDETGVTVQNSRISAYYDYDEMVAVYDVADPDDWDDSMADSGTASNQLNIFLDKANDPSFNEESLEWWFMDKSLPPGYSGGNKFAVIYVENSTTPIYVNSSRLINRNYTEYGTLSEAALEEGQTPADNLLVSVESGGTGNIYFTNENSSTVWDLTGETEETCELEGDFYVEETASASDNADAGSGANTLNAVFTASEWEGAVLRGDDTGGNNDGEMPPFGDEGDGWQGETPPTDPGTEDDIPANGNDAIILEKQHIISTDKGMDRARKQGGNDPAPFGQTV